MRKTKLKTSDQIRKALDECGMTRYAIYKATGIDQATLCRFVSGEGGLSMDSLDKIGELIGLEIIVKKKGSK